MTETALEWYDVSTWPLEGKGWTDTDVHYARIPARAEATVRDWIWMLGHHTAGLIAVFESDASEIWVRYNPDAKNLPAFNRPRGAGQAGYGRHGQKRTGFLRAGR